MPDMQMAMFPEDQEAVSGAVIGASENHQPGANGPRVYLNGGNDLSTILDRVEPAGGTVIVPKTEISPEHGFFGLFADPEGNMIGLHSQN